MYSCTVLHCSALYTCTEPVTDLALALMLRSGTDSDRPPRWLSGEMHLWFLKWTLKHAVHELKLKIEVFLGFLVKISLFLAVQDWSLTFTKCISNIIFILQAEVVDSIDIGAPAAVWEVDINPVTELQVGMVPSKDHIKASEIYCLTDQPPSGFLQWTWHASSTLWGKCLGWVPCAVILVSRLGSILKKFPHMSEA